MYPLCDFVSLFFSFLTSFSSVSSNEKSESKYFRFDPICGDKGYNPWEKESKENILRCLKSILDAIFLDEIFNTLILNCKIVLFSICIDRKIL